MENKTGKYFKYAVGEVLLVVVGILIALWINNQNQQRLNDQKIESILMAVQFDIMTDTYFSEWFINKYIVQDEIHTKILTNQYDLDALTDKELSELNYISSSSPEFKALSNGYEQLKANVNDIPDRYMSIYKKLAILHDTSIEMLEESNIRSNAIRDNYFDYLAINEPWYALDEFNSEVSIEQKNYYRNSLIFKNHVHKVQNYFHYMMDEHIRYRQRVMEIYVMIDDVIGEKGSVQPEDLRRNKRIRVTSLETAKEADRLAGTYQLSSGPDHTVFGKKLEIKAEGEDLYIFFTYPILPNFDQNEPIKLLFAHHEKPWFGFRHRHAYLLRFEEQGENTLSIIIHNKASTHWKKVIE